MSALAKLEPGSILRMSELVGPHERQQQFLEAVKTYKYVLYGGAAGGGKSYILRWWLLVFLLYAWHKYAVRGVRVGLFCEDYPTLRDRQISKIKHEFPKEFGELKNTKDEGLIFALRKEHGEGFISLRNLDDPSKYQSTEFAAIGVEELTKNRHEVFEQLRQRLRWPGFPVGFNFPFAGATNPGGVGHEWVKRYWIDRDFPSVLNPEDFVYIPAKASDNPHNPADYYEKNLLTIVDERERRARADGDWDLFEGQFFGEWRRELHVCEPFAIPPYWRRFRASDFGFDAPWATGWFAVDPDGDVWVYRELYERRRDPEWMAREVLRLSAGEQIDYTSLDPACWDASRGPSIAEQCGRAGWPCIKADNNRMSGWTQVRRFLAWEKNDAGVLLRRPKLHVFSTCSNLIRTLPAIPYSRVRPEDLDTDAEDHAVDYLRYGLMSRPLLPARPAQRTDHLPAQDQKAIATHNRWAQKFDRQARGGGDAWF